MSYLLFCHHTKTKESYCLKRWNHVKSTRKCVNLPRLSINKIKIKNSHPKYIRYLWKIDRRNPIQLVDLKHNIRKVKFLSKNSNSTKPQHFHEFFTPFFFFRHVFSWNQSCQQLKSPAPQHFHEFFTQKIDSFNAKSRLNFWTKNEDFEQCEI